MGRRAALAALLITAVFAGVRHRIYEIQPAAMPCANDPVCADWAREQPDPAEALAEAVRDSAAWSRRDALMNWPRLAAFLACLAAMAAWGGASRGRWRGLSSSFVLLAAVGAAQALGAVSFGPRSLAAWQIAGGLWANVFVVLWEEACYRGLLYLGLRESMKPVPAALLSSAAFTVMHWQAQPFSSWPWIFCYGVVCCAALEFGTGLFWLMLVHWLVDSVYFAGGGGAPSSSLDLFGRFMSALCAAWGLILLSAEATRTAEAAPGSPEGWAPAKRP